MIIFMRTLALATIGVAWFGFADMLFAMGASHYLFSDGNSAMNLWAYDHGYAAVSIAVAMNLFGFSAIITWLVEGTKQ